jgi:hypothetical protein
LDTITTNNRHWGETEATVLKNPVKAVETEANSTMQAQINAIHKMMMAMFMVNQAKIAPANAISSPCCDICNEEHVTDNCPLNPASVFYVGQQGNQNQNRWNPYSDTYNPGWRQHPNFSWEGQASTSNSNTNQFGKSPAEFNSQPTQQQPQKNFQPVQFQN